MGMKYKYIRLTAKQGTTQTHMYIVHISIVKKCPPLECQSKRKHNLKHIRYTTDLQYIKEQLKCIFGPIFAEADMLLKDPISQQVIIGGSNLLSGS
jgi:hypothetical protein